MLVFALFSRKCVYNLNNISIIFSRIIVQYLISEFIRKLLLIIRHCDASLPINYIEYSMIKSNFSNGKKKFLKYTNSSELF